MPGKSRLNIRQIAEKTLKSSETLYKSLFENASDGIFLLQDLLIQECNPRSLKMFGYSKKADLIGRRPSDISPEFQPDGERSVVAAAKYLDRVFKGEAQSFEWLHSRADGSDLYTEISLSRINFDNDTYILAFLRDISARKRMENELIDLQVYLQLQIEKMPIGLIIWDADFKVKSWNPSAEDIFGFKEDEVIGKHPYETIVPEEAAKDTRAILKSLLQKDESVYRTNENITKSGRIITCSWSNTPFKKYDGEIIGVLSMVQDVTEQKRAESELKTYQNYLEELVRERTVELEVANFNLDEKEKSVRLLSEITSASNLSIDPEEAIVFAIERFSEHAGWPLGHMVYVDQDKGEITPSGIWYISDNIRNSGISELLMNCSFESEDCPINMAVKSKKPQYIGNIKSCDCPLIDQLVNDFHFTNSFVFPIEVENRIVGVLQFLFEETGPSSKRFDELAAQIGVQLGMAIDRKRIGDELLRAKSRAEEANRSKSQFLANMSHEIRTPMNSILGFADILSTRMSDKKNISYLESIRSSAAALLQILNDILDLSKVEAGKMEVDPVEVSLDSFFNNIIDLFRQNIHKKGLSLDCRISKSLPDLIIIDKLRLRQIIINILSNAVKFTDKGGLVFCVETEDIKPESLTMIISIEDTGVGISDHFMQHLFEPFQQEDADISRRYEGTGLGLAITKRLVDVLGGVVFAESRKGEGSKFTVVLKDIAICKNPDKTKELSSITSKMISFKNKKVLLVEDNLDDQNFFKALLLDVGIKVKIASGGKDALELLESFMPDLVLSDIRMPDIDGYMLLKTLKSDARLSGIPVIAITASAMSEDISRIKKHDFESYLLKPVQMSEFYSAIMNILPYEKLNYQPGNIMKSKDDFLPESVMAKLPSVINVIETKYNADWEKLRKKQPIEMVEQFGDDILNLGNDYNIELLREYGSSLKVSVDSFDVELIKKNISDFPGILKKLKLYNKQKDE